MCRPVSASWDNGTRLGEAIPLLEGAYRASARNPTLGWVGLELLTAYVRAGKATEVGPLAADRIRNARKQMPEGSPELAPVLASCGSALLDTGSFAEAEKALRECPAIRQNAQPDAWTTFNTMSMLGGALLGQNKYTDAEPLLVKGYEGLKARERTIPTFGGGEVRIAEALDRLIDLYTATGQPDEVKKWSAERKNYPNIAPPPRELK